MTRIDQLNDIGKRGNFYVVDYSPGDGKTRYKFFVGSEERRDFFSDFGVHTAIGFKEAKTFAEGWLEGYAEAERLAEIAKE